MAINILSPTFKFASIRNPKPMELAPDIISVMPDTNLILSIVSINESPDVIIPKQYSPAIIADNCDTNNP